MASRAHGSMHRAELEQVAIDFCFWAARLVTPQKRTSGFTEIEGQERGHGDALGLLATIAVVCELRGSGVESSMEIHSGGGDRHDISVRGKAFNVKASKFSPAREGLHLYVKQEELAKDFSGYIQVFVHLHEQDDPTPHVHIAGVAGADRLRGRPIVTIPGTGHQGVAAPCTELFPWSGFVSWALPPNGR